MMKRKVFAGFTLIVLMLIALFAGCRGQGSSSLKGKTFQFAGFGDDIYDLDTYQPRNEEDFQRFEYRKNITQEYGFTARDVGISDWGNYFPLVINNILTRDKSYHTYWLSADQAFMLYKQGLLFPLNESSVKLDNREAIPGQRPVYNEMMEKLLTINGKQFAATPMPTGGSWQGIFVFWNKRIFRDAGLDPDLPYDLQRDGKWTWDEFHRIARQITRDLNNDGIVDIYGLPCDDPREVLNAFIYGNNANWVTIDDNGKFHNTTNTPEFIEALQYYRTLLDDGVMKPRPPESAWDWDYTDFVYARVGMLIAAEWRKGQLVQAMADEYGCVLPPKGPRADNYRMGLTESVYVIPVIFSKEEVDLILEAYNLWNAPTPGVETDWRIGQYGVFHDRRAVDETMALARDERNVTYRNFSLIPGFNIGEYVWDFCNFTGTPAQLVEQFGARVDAVIDDANKE